MSEEQYKNFAKLLQSTVSNLSQSFYDSYVAKSVQMARRFGYNTTITRRVLYKCCDWCSNMAGTYEYGEHPADIFKRHSNCRCLVTYNEKKDGSKGYTDVWSKKEYDTQREARLAREQEINTELLKNNQQNSKIRQTGAKGALNSKNDPKGKRRKAHAELYYEELRNADENAIVDSMALNSGVDRQIVAKAYSHVFTEKHNLEEGYRFFDPDYDMAESFRRLRTNDNIQPHDVILLQHEALENQIMQENPSMSYNDAHKLAEQSFNYRKALSDWLKENGNI